MATINLITKLFDKVLYQPPEITVSSYSSFGDSGSSSTITETISLKAGFPAHYYSGSISRSFGRSPYILMLNNSGIVLMVGLSEDDVIVTSSVSHGSSAPTGFIISTSITPDPYLISQPNIGWNGAALSNETFRGNGFVTFNCPINSAGVVAGLNEYSGRLNSNYSDINNGFIMRSGKYQIIEGNTIIAGESAFIESDLFKIERFDGYVKYYVNGVLLRAVAADQETDLYLDVSLYLSGDSLADAVLTDNVDTQFAIAQDATSVSGLITTGNVTIADEVFVAETIINSTSSLDVTYTDNLFTQTLTAVSTVSVQQPFTTNGGGQQSAMQAFKGKASDYVYSGGDAVIEPFTGEGGYGGVVINTGISVNTVMPLFGSAIGTNGQLNTPSTTSTTAYFDGLAADHAYGEGVGITEAFNAIGGEFLPARNGNAIIFDGVSSQGNGILLTGGKHLLTAAHVVDSIVDNALVQIIFDTHESVTVALPVVTGITIHPLWTGDAFAGNDLAVIELSQAVDPIVLRHELYKAKDEISQTFEKKSYSPRYDPTTGEVSASGWDAINNKYDANSSIVNDLVSGSIGLDNQLMFDYDNGDTVNDALGSLYGLTGTGVINEGGTYKGDSGSGSLIDGKVAGILSWAMSIGSPPDVTAITDGTYGEVHSETRVSSFIDWIDAVVGNAAQATLSFPLISIEASATSGSVNETLITGFTTDIDAYTGAVMVASNLTVSVEASATNIPVARASLPFPSITIEATALTGSTAKARLNYVLNKDIEAYSGAQAVVGGFTTVIEANGKLGATAKADIRTPLISIEASGLRLNSVRATIRPPYIEMVYGIALITGFTTKITAKELLDCEVL